MKDMKPKNDQTDDNLVWGIHPVHELLAGRPGSIHEIIIQKGKSGQKLREIIDLARDAGIKVNFSADFRMTGNKQMNHQGVIARVAPFATLDEDAFLALLEQHAPPFVLVLDSIQDPHNLGAIIRSASAAGVTGLIIPKDRSAQLSGTVAKISAGASASLPVCQVTNVARMLQKLKEMGMWIYGTVKDGGTSIYQTTFSGAVCLVIGGEEKGIRPLIGEQCDFKVTIPMQRHLDSLNASVAAGVVMFEIVRQRTGSE